MPSATNLTPAEQTREELLGRLRKRTQRIEGGPWDGVPMVTEKDIDEAFTEPLEPTSETAAEVRTPARVVVDAVCPRCSISTAIAMQIEPKVVQDPSGTEIQLVVRKKARGHQCFQEVLPVGEDAEAEGQGAFELSDIADDEPAGDEPGVDAQEGDQP